MLPSFTLDSAGHQIQVSLTPVFLLSGIAALLNVFAAGWHGCWTGWTAWKVRSAVMAGDADEQPRAAGPHAVPPATAAFMAAAPRALAAPG